MKRTAFLSAFIAISTAAALPLGAQTSDAPPVDIGQLLQELKKLRDQNEGGIKARRMNAFNQVRDAASSGEKAIAFWKEAVKSVQFEGAKNEGAQIREWREEDGEALNDKLCQGAARLHLQWLALSLQHAAGQETKQLLPQIIEHTRAVQADEAAADHLADQLKKARDRDSRSPGARRVVQEDSVVKRVHDIILRTPVTDTAVARWLQIKEVLDDGRPRGGQAKQTTGSASWEFTPGDVEGIYGSIILPEYRAAKDPRLLDYWDMKLKRESERAATRQLDVEQREWTQERRPRILWGRTQDVMLLGQKNRAVMEMFNLVKTFPHHPDAPNWITTLESLLGSPAPASPATSSTTSGVAPANGAVPPPAAVPPPTGNVPVGTIVPSAPAPGVRPPAR